MGGGVKRVGGTPGSHVAAPLIHLVPTSLLTPPLLGNNTSGPRWWWDELVVMGRVGGALGVTGLYS